MNGWANIQDATNATLTVTNAQDSDQVNYRVIVSNGAGTNASSYAALTIVHPPCLDSAAPSVPGTYYITSQTELSVNAFAEGTSKYLLHYQWYHNGVPIAVACYSNFVVNLEIMSEGDFSVVITNAAGSTNVGTWKMRPVLPGTVAVWGANDSGQYDRPANFTNAIALAAGENHAIALSETGSIQQWGQYWTGSAYVSLVGAPTNTDLISVAAGREHDLALRANGTVLAWGVTGANANWVPTNLTGVKAIDAGWNHNVALLS